MLFEPLTLRSGPTLRNRIALAPLTNTMSEADGRVSADDLRFYTLRAAGGFALVSTCAAYVSAEGKAWRGQLGIAEAAHADGLAQLATAIRDEGAVAVVQLHHGGAKAEQAPARLSTADAPGVRGATAADLQRVVDDFVAAARRAEAAGFDGVEVHGANGYLFTQFLAPGLNPRTDAWGGALAGRAKLLLDTVRAVRAATGEGFAVGVRLSPVDHWEQRGLRLADGVQVGQWLVEAGADWVHLSTGDAMGRPPHESDAPPVVRAFREALPEEVAIFGVGGLWTGVQAEKVLALGADVAVLGKAAMAHPDWPRQVRDPDFLPVRPPWTRAHLRAAGLGEAFLAYVGQFPGMLEGGPSPR